MQIDGGSENANQYLLAMIELLAMKKMVRVAYVTRLPTGHTHSDIDAVFAIIWKLFRSAPCVTLQAYKDLIEKALSDSALGEVKMVDCMVIPDYKLLLENCIDSKLGLMHKEGATQHQWRFQSVVKSIHFPLGVKTTYRAYCSDYVVEFFKKPKLQCLSIIGQFTGLEPVKTVVQWYPSPKCNPERPVEGFYILLREPNCEGPRLRPQEFPEGCSQAINSTLSAVKGYFDNVNDKEVCVAWKTWAFLNRPQSDSAEAFVRWQLANAIPYHQPLKMFLYDPTRSVVPIHWLHVAVEAETLRSDFKWPLIIAVAMNSVQSEMNPLPPRPRLTTATNPDLLQRLEYFKTSTGNYYEMILELAKPAIISLLIRRVYYRGDIPTSTGKHDFVITLIHIFFNDSY